MKEIEYDALQRIFDACNNRIEKFLADCYGNFNHRVQYEEQYRLLPSEQVHALVRYLRASKKFQRPADADQENLHRRTLQKWLKVDQDLDAYLEEVSLFRQHKEVCTVDERPVLKRITRLNRIGATQKNELRLIRMKHIIHRWIKGAFREWLPKRLEVPEKDLNRVFIHTAGLTWTQEAWVGPGETFFTSQGRTCDFDKFINTELWSCTRKCFPYFATFLYANRPLRRWVLERARSKGVSHGTWFDKLAAITHVASGARITTVPKNNEKRRPINIEPLGNSIVQKAIGRFLQHVLARQGNDLATLQDIQRSRIQSSLVSTLDLSDASDRVSLDLVRYLFPQEFVDLLEDARSSLVVIDDNLLENVPSKDTVMIDGVKWYRPRKISCQGNGYTFPLMTMILLAACKACGDNDATVFGDDTVCANETAQDIVELYEYIGFKVNTEKSFIASQFKEACGGYVVLSEEGVAQNIMCYDLKWITNPPELFATLNKIACYVDENGIDTCHWKQLHDDLISLVPDEYKGPMPPRGDLRDRLDSYVWLKEMPNHLNRGSACDWLDKRYQRLAGSIRRVTTYVPEFQESNTDDPLKGRFERLVGSALRLRAMRPVDRNRRGVAGWRAVTMFVDELGALMLKKQYDYLRNHERNFLKMVYECDTVSRPMWDSWTYVPVSLQRYFDALDTAAGKSNYLHK